MANAQFIVKHGKTENTISGPYFAVVLNLETGRVSSSCSGIRTPDVCDARAEEYARSFGAAIETPMLTY